MVTYIHCWCKYNLVQLFQDIFCLHCVLKTSVTEPLKVQLQLRLITMIIEHLLFARHLLKRFTYIMIFNLPNSLKQKKMIPLCFLLVRSIFNCYLLLQVLETFAHGSKLLTHIHSEMGDMVYCLLSRRWSGRQEQDLPPSALDQHSWK